MADENVIGVTAVLDTSDFEAGAKRLDTKIAALEKDLDKFEKQQEANAKKTADAARKAADEEEKAANKRERSLRKFGIAFAAVSVAVVKGYEALRDSATRFGDTELEAQFAATDTTLAALRDTFAATALEVLRVSDAIPFINDGLIALNQIAIITGANMAALTERLKAAFTAGGGTTIFERFTSPAASASAEQAYRTAFQNITSAPGRATSATNIAKASAEADKQRQKDQQSIMDYYKKLEDMQIKAGEDILSAEKDYHDKSAEAWQDYMERTSDIIAEGVQKRAELARDYAEQIADAETEYNKSVESAAYDHGKRMADIERDYQRTVANIQQTYQEDALDAVRNLDAIAFIRAKEKRDKDLANAARSRDEATSDESQSYSRQLYELQRSLEDKKREAEQAYQRGLADQQRAESEALQDAKNSYNKQVTEAAKAQAEKLAAIKAGYSNENAAAQAQYGYAESAYAEHLRRMQALTAAYGIGAGTSSRGPGTMHRRQEGGLDVVNSPTQFLAGEAGPELVYTAPLGRSIPYASPQVVTHTGEFQHSIDSTIRSSVAGIDGRIVAAITKTLREVLG